MVQIYRYIDSCTVVYHKWDNMTLTCGIRSVGFTGPRTLYHGSLPHDKYRLKRHRNVHLVNLFKYGLSIPTESYSSNRLVFP